MRYIIAASFSVPAYTLHLQLYISFVQAKAAMIDFQAIWTLQRLRQLFCISYTGTGKIHPLVMSIFFRHWQGACMKE